jgi:hypothetical protein
MRIRRVIAIAAGLVVASTCLAVAQQQRPDRLSDRQLKDLVDRIDTHRSVFDASVGRAIDLSRINGSVAEAEMDRSLKSFEQAARLLRDRVHDRHADRADAENVLRRASVIDDFMTRTQLDASAQIDWQALRLDMNDLARAYGVTWSWNAASQNMPPRVDDRRVEQLLTQIAQKSERFEENLDRAFDRGRNDDRRAKDEARQSVKDFRHATERLRDRVKGRESTTLDVEEVLRRAVSIDDHLRRHQLSAQAGEDWRSLRGDLDELARAYNVPWNWSRPSYTHADPGVGALGRLTGTYQYEARDGDDPRQAAERAVGNAPSDQKQRTLDRLLARLEAPELIAIDRHENSVTIASTRGPRLTVDADGRDHTERWSDERTMNTRATLAGERLVVATTGNRGSDFTVTFDPMADGRGLLMTRTIDDEGLRQAVTVRSAYRRLSNEAQWDIDAPGRRNPYNNTSSPAGDLVPDGTRLVATLDHPLSTATVRDGDLYTMTVRSPSRYEGAVIQGVVSGVDESGRRVERGMTLNVRSIRLRTGASHRLDAVIEGIRTPDGATVRVDREGALDKDDRQARQTVERGAIGAALGALIGAVAGGGKGAAIGAVIGAGGGAGTVLVAGRDRLELQRGTELTIRAGDLGNPRTISGLPGWDGR